MNAVDTNVFVYAFDSREPIKKAKAQELLDRLSLVPKESLLMWQVAGEFLARLRKWESAGRITGDDVDDHFGDVIGMFELRIPTRSIFAVSFGLHSRYSLSHWDSMLLAGCKEAGVDLLYTEDLADGADYDGVKIVNPFA
jgi:predicted nucleic acid-binding protein